MKPTKEQICTLLDAWIRQRPGLDFANYGDVSAYRSELRGITRDLSEARQLLRAVELSGITGEELAAAFPRAFSGRLVLQYRAGKVMQWVNVSDLPAGYPFADDSQFRLDYCTGQYWPTEYLAAACAVLASALWHYVADHCMPPVSGYKVAAWYGKPELFAPSFRTREEAESFLQANGGNDRGHVTELHAGLSAGDWIRKHFRREFGRGIASRWFN